MAYYGDCQYSSIAWLAKDSSQFKALMAGLHESNPRRPEPAKQAFTTFLQTLASGQEAFRKGMKPGADLSSLLKNYQAATGIISTKDFTLPDVPNDPGHPIDNSFITDLVEGIAGAASTEVGIGITVYTLVMDLIQLLNIKLHVRGMLMNASNADLDDINLEFVYADPNVLPLSTSIPASKPVMNPLDKKNYDCVGFAFFGAVGVQDLEGCFLNLAAVKKAPAGGDELRMYYQFYDSLKGVAPGNDQGHDQLWDVWNEPPAAAVVVDGGFLNTVCLFCCE